MKRITLQISGQEMIFSGSKLIAIVEEHFAQTKIVHYKLKEQSGKKLTKIKKRKGMCRIHRKDSKYKFSTKVKINVKR